MRLRYRTPVTVFLNVTARCNLSCVYCSADAGRARHDELDDGEMHRLVDELLEHRVLQVIITGGEPLIRRDTLDVVATLRQANVAVQINTNGTLLSRRTCERLKTLGIRRVSVSLDGPADVNRLTRGAGSFGAATRGIRALVAAGIKPLVLCTLNRHNMHALEATVEHCRQAGASGLSINPLSAVGRGLLCHDELSLEDREWHLAVQSVRRLQAAYAGFVHEGFCHWSDYPHAVEKAEPRGAGNPARVRFLLPCDAAKTFCAVTPDGWVLPCNKFATYRCGNVRTESLSAIWQGDAMERIRSLAGCPVTEARTCSACRYTVVCSGGCRAEAYGAFGTLDAPDPTCAVLPDSAIHALRSSMRQPAAQLPVAAPSSNPVSGTGWPATSDSVVVSIAKPS